MVADGPFPPMIPAHIITISGGPMIQVVERQPYSRARYPWVSDQVVMSPFDMVAQRLSFPYGSVGASFLDLPTPGYNGFNSFAALDRNEADTGGRPDIRLNNDWAARSLITGNFDGMMQTAEAAGTCPFFLIDVNTGKLASKITYPSLNNYGYGRAYHGAPWFGAAPSSDYGVNLAPNHIPQVSYAAAIVARSTWHFENLCAAANYPLIQNGSVTPENLPCITASEQRAAAWGMRDSLMASAAAKFFAANNIPLGIGLPQSYWDTVIAQTAKYHLEPWRTDPEFSVAHLPWADGSGACAPWQQGHWSGALAFGILTGHKELVPFYLKQLQGLIDLSSGKSGWNKRIPCPYFLYTGAYAAEAILPSWSAIFARYIAPKGSAPGAQLGDTLKQSVLDEITARPDINVLADVDGQGEYIQILFFALAAAMYLQQEGILDVVSICPDLPLSYQNILEMIQNLEATRADPYHGWKMSDGYALTLNKGGVTKTIVQPTPLGYQGIPLPSPPPAPAPDPQPETPPMTNPDQQKIDNTLAKARAADSEGDKLLGLVQRLIAAFNALKGSVGTPDPNTVTMTRAEFDELSSHIDGLSSDVTNTEAAIPPEDVTP